MEFKVGKSEANQRLDLFLLAKLPVKFSRSYIQKAIKEGKVKVNQKVQKPSYKVKPGDVIFVEEPAVELKPIAVEPEPIHLDILYEDHDIIVVNKPAGMVVHPIPAHMTGTLVNALLYHCKDLQGIGGELRPGIVHRLDKDTSGVIVVAKNDLAHQSLSKQFKDRKVFKMYFALVQGCVKNDEGEIQLSLARHPVHRIKMTVSETGRKSITLYKVLKRFKDLATLVVAYPKTGRTHQIRVHMKFIGHPIIGDPLYGKKSFEGIERQMLHAARLGFFHPRTGEYVQFTAPLPEDFKQAIRMIHRMCLQ
ncbi:RluA family pseudouridine synthase [Pseudothermotoga thermarum]|uniref:Pseudouridine synthase n=1 Tax=Pseudothermotoga thermarum DSM 5069 TaxID=688269 RepID=F7YXP4_9THEM|nr:RluA family pseudouridine synthase [Pseudothermotoga thermarum]AEH50688.1 ribosomal large subunit pseudouridine synthase D [Pseudothermotoga thermarum DSM 5069]